MTDSLANAYLCLGSNLGDKNSNLARALRKLDEYGAHCARVSSVYRTEPVERVDQEWFLNQVVWIQTKLTPQELLRTCLRIEDELGRERYISKGPRVIDLDILLYDDLVLNDPALLIPHPRLHLRRFVLVPLAELGPTLVHPINGNTVAELLAACRDSAQVEKI